MSLIAEYETRLTQMQQALRAVPEMTVRHDEIYFTPERQVKWMFWASGGDHDEFQAALAEDPSVETARVIAETPSQRLYSATLVGDPDDFTLSVINELDIQVLDATHDHERTIIRVRCPSRESFATLRTVVEDQYGRFVTHRLYAEESPEVPGFSVTSSQREALLLALESGYYDVPRNATLQAIADVLGISDQALSSRLRRGMATLLRDTLARDSPDVD